MFTTRPELAGTFGMVASTHWLASAAGMAILERGGNAFDAAAAVGFTLHVCEPHMNGPGGELPAIFTTAADPTPRVLCGQGVAPAAATIDRYRELGLDLVPGTGLLAATVPGAVGAWLTLLRDHGTMPLRDVLDFAIGYAEHGHPVAPAVVDTINTVAELFRTYWPTSAQLWLPRPAPGDVIRNPALARTYRRLVEEAEAAGGDRDRQYDAAMRAWYEGFVAEAIDEFCRTEIVDDTGRRHTGLLTGADLAAWRPSYEPTVSLDVFGWQVHKVGAWSQGPVLLQQLATLEAMGDVPPPGSAELIHRVVEVAKLSFADRDANYGDGADLTALLSPAYAAERARLVTDEAGPALRNGLGRLPAWVREGRAPAGPAGLGIGEPTLGGARPDEADPHHGADKTEGPGLDRHPGQPAVRADGVTQGDTCHIDVADRWGNVISVTPSGGWLQSSPAIPELGFCLGTRAQMFWLEEDLPNSLAPGRRPRTTLTPSFAQRDGVRLSFGTPGGDQQDQWQLVFFLNHAVHGMNLQEAIDAPSWHTTAFPASFYPRQTAADLVVEERVGEAVLAELRRRGHQVDVADPWSLGRMSAVSARGGLLRAAANPRGQQGYAAGR